MKTKWSKNLKHENERKNLVYYRLKTWKQNEKLSILQMKWKNLVYYRKTWKRNEKLSILQT